MDRISTKCAYYLCENTVEPGFGVPIQYCTDSCRKRAYERRKFLEWIKKPEATKERADLIGELTEFRFEQARAMALQLGEALEERMLYGEDTDKPGTALRAFNAWKQATVSN